MASGRRRHRWSRSATSDVWKFGFLERAEKRIVEDLNTYSVPTDIEEVVELLNGILTE